MTLAIASTFRPPVRDWTRAMPLKEAAGRLGVSVDTLTRRCAANLAGRGLAFFDRPPNGGKAQWFVCHAYDPKLQPSIIADRYAESDLSGFSAKQRNTAFARRQCVSMVAELERTTNLSAPAIFARVAVYAAALTPPLKVARRSLYRWREAYRHPCDLIELVDQRGGDRRSQGSPLAWAEFRRLFLNDHRPTVREVWKLVGGVAADHGWPWCSLKSCEYQLNDRIPPQDQTKYREPAKYRSALAPYVEQPADRYDAGACWIGDHKCIDLICSWRNQKIRPWLTAWMDWRTRKIVGFILSASPNSSSILAAFRRGMLDASNRGGPGEVWIDNGKDYAAQLFHGTTKLQRRQPIDCRVNEAHAVGIFGMLEIEPHFSLEYNPNGKARLERWFGNLTSFSRKFQTYTGTGVDDKPESHTAASKSPGKIPTFEEVESRIAQFIAGYNLNAEHEMADLAEAGERLAPAEAFAQWCTRERKMADPAALDLCLETWGQPVRVGRNGIKLWVRNAPVRYGQFDAVLSPYKAKRHKDRQPLRVSYDSADLRTIKVWTLDWKFVGTVTMNQQGGQSADPINADRLGDILAEQRAYSRAAALVNKNAYTRTLTNEEQLALASVPPLVVPSPPADSMRIVQTPLDGESKAVRREAIRRAAGAENQPHPDDDATPIDWISKWRGRPAARQDDTPDFAARYREDEHGT